MQALELDDVTIHYRDSVGFAEAPVVVFVNSLGTDFRIWDDVVARLAGKCRTIAYDKRGHGLSSLGTMPYTMSDHARDLAGLLDALDVGQALICGVSVGGQIAQELYFQRPDLVAALVLSGTAAKIGEPEFWRQRMEAIEQGGLASMTDGIMERWFSPQFRKPGNPHYQMARAMFERQPVQGYLATCAAIADFDRRAETPNIAVPTSVVVGSSDGSTPPDLVRAFAAEIAGATFACLEGPGHLPCMEAPEAIARIVEDMIIKLDQGAAKNVR